MLQARPGRPGMGSPCRPLPTQGPRAVRVSRTQALRTGGPAALFFEGGWRSVAAFGHSIPTGGTAALPGSRGRGAWRRTGTRPQRREPWCWRQKPRSRTPIPTRRRPAGIGVGAPRRRVARRTRRSPRKRCRGRPGRESSRPGICGLLRARLGVVPPSMHREASARLLGSATPTRAHPTAWPGPAPVDGCALR